MLLQGNFDPSEDGIAIEQQLLQWLKGNGSPSYRIVGKAVTFRACFEHLFRRSFTPQGCEQSLRWAASQSEDALRELKETRQTWIAVGKSWDELVREHLLDKVLYEWQKGQLLNTSRVGH
jgi:hypothetical protein